MPRVLRALVLTVLVAGCAQPSPDKGDPVDPLGALGLVEVEAPFAHDGTTLCLPEEGGDDVACEPGTGARILLGPFDAVITGLNVTASWVADRPTTQELILTVWCHESGTTANPVRCDGVAEKEVRGTSPLAIAIEDIETPTTALLEIRLTEPEAALGIQPRTRQAFHVEGIVTYAPEPDATNRD